MYLSFTTPIKAFAHAFSYKKLPGGTIRMLKLRYIDQMWMVAKMDTWGIILLALVMGDAQDTLQVTLFSAFFGCRRWQHRNWRPAWLSKKSRVLNLSTLSLQKIHLESLGNLESQTLPHWSHARSESMLEISKVLMCAIFIIRMDTSQGTWHPGARDHLHFQGIIFISLFTQASFSSKKLSKPMRSRLEPKH